VKRCGKSAPLAQQCSRHGKPHTEQDQIGKEWQRPGERQARACSLEPDARAKQAQAVAEPLKECLRAGSVRQGERSFDSSESLRISAAGLNARRTPQLPGRSLEPFSNGRPRGMTVSGGNAVQNSAYRFDVTCGPQVVRAI